MKIRSLFALAQDTRDVLDFFERVESTNQMVSALERLKRNEAEDFLVCIEALKNSLAVLLNDTIEFGSDFEDDDGDDGEDGDDLDDETLRELNLVDDESPPQTPEEEKKVIEQP